jgi:hypothetical protein
MNLIKRIGMALVGCAISFGSAANAHAELPGTLGVGLGEGTLASGISGKANSGGIVYQGVIGSVRGRGYHDRYGYRHHSGLGLSLDALVSRGNIVAGQLLALDWSAGFGGGVGFAHDDVAFAMAAVAGLEFNFRPIPLDVAIEARPNILIVPDVDFDFDITAHIRIWFQ